MNKIACLLIIVCSVFFYSVAESAIKVKDFRGKEIILKKPAKRVVCLIESALTGIYMLGAQDKVIGVPTNIYEEGYFYNETFKYYAALDARIKNKKIPALGNWEKVDIEKIVALEPDLVIIWSNQMDIITSLEKIGIPVYGVFITKIEDVFKEILDFGKLLDSEKRALELVDYIKKEIENIRLNSLKIKNKKEVFFSWAQLNFLQTSCSGSIVNEILDLIGAKNICSDINGESVLLNIESLLSKNPDVIVMWHSKSMNPEDFKENSQLRNLKAVKTNSIYEFHDTFSYDLWTLKFIYAAHYMANKVYPEIYSYNLAKKRSEIMKFLYKKEFNF